MRNNQISKRQIGIALAFIVIAVMIGLIIAATPLAFSVKTSFLIIALIYIIIILMLPDRQQISHTTLIAMICATLALFFLWPRYAYLPINALPTKNPQRLWHAIVLLAVFYALSTDKNLRQRCVQKICSAKAIFLLVFGIFFWRIVTSATSGDIVFSLYITWIEIFEYLACFLLTVIVVDTIRDVEIIFNVLLSVAAIVCTIGLAEYFFKKNLFESLILIDDTRAEYFAEVLSNKIRGGEYRIKSTFAHPLLLAEFITSIIPIALYRSMSKGLVTKLLMILLSLGITVNLYLTQSRSALAASAIITVLFLGHFSIRHIRQKKFSLGSIFSILSIPAIVGGAVAVAILLANLSSGRTAEERTSSNARVTMFENSLPLISQSPLIGYGPGAGAHKLGFIGEGGIITLDNFYLVTVLDSGLPQLLLTLAMFIWVGFQYVRSLKITSRLDSLRVMTLTLSCISIFIFKSILGTTHNFPLLFSCLGMLLLLNSGFPENSRQSFR